MKRILHIITDLPVGGAERVLHHLLSRLDRAAFESAVLCLGEGGPMAELISKLDVQVFMAGRSLRRLHQSTTAFKPDLIQGWMYHGNVASLVEQVRLPGHIPMIWNIRHSLLDPGLEKRFTAMLIRAGAWFSSRPARIIFNSRSAAEQHRIFGYNSARFVVIPNGFDSDYFKPDPAAKSSVCMELGLEETIPLIGLFARYHPIKDHPTFLNAASLLLRSGLQANFMLVGSRADDDNPGLARQIADFGISRQVRCLGLRHDMSRLNAALDIATNSSSGESFSNAVGEAMTCAVPCVVTDVGDSAELIGDTGIAVPPRNAEALASAWRDLLERGSEERHKLGMRARDRIIRHFSLDLMVTRYRELYEETLNARDSAEQGSS